MKRAISLLLSTIMMLSVFLGLSSLTLAEDLTAVGTPRSETLIVDTLSGNLADPDLINPYIPGAVAADAGIHQLIFSVLWEIDTLKGEQFGEIAETFPEPVDDTYTKFTFKIREGLKWSDGEDLTAYDVEFTSNTILEAEEIPYNGFYSSLVKSMVALDEHTIELETVNPEMKLAQRLGVVIFGQAFKVLPKHIFENEDIATYKFTEAVSSGPYTLIERDPNGNWFLYEKREDWESTPVGQIVGEPAPKYVLFQYLGNEEKRVIGMINHDIDILQDISPESWDILQSRNEYAHAWYSSFPYGTFNDPCERGLDFQTEREPFNELDVRWALALSMDIKEVSMATFGGMLRVSPLHLPPIDVLQELYHKPMTEWLTEFALEDGYQPFDPNFAADMVEMLTDSGYEDLPTDPEEQVDLFGVGWWKYDPEKATALLEKHGFTFENDQWLLPDGTPWEITINVPADFEIQSMRLGFAVADAWNKFGIKAEARQMDHSSFWNAEGTGNYDVGSYWPVCGLLPDVTADLQGWHSDYYSELGEIVSTNKASMRWTNDELSDIIDEMAAIPSDDEQIVPMAQEALKILVEEIPFLPMFGTSKFVPYDSYHWTGFQNADNPFEGPWWWWSQFKYYLPHLEPATH